jgi:hypothetical protein
MKPESDSPQRRDVYTRVTNQIIAELERGVPTYRLWRSNRMLGAQCGLRIPNFPGGRAGELASLHCKAGHAVLIESSLRSQSPENGSISNIRRRLSAISRPETPIPEPGDRQPIRKSPPLAGLCRIVEGKVSGRRTGWLGREDSNLRMVESKSTALPLGDAPIDCPESGRDLLRARPADSFRPRRSIEGVEPFQQARAANSP